MTTPSNHFNFLRAAHREIEPPIISERLADLGRLGAPSTRGEDYPQDQPRDPASALPLEPELIHIVTPEEAMFRGMTAQQIRETLEKLKRDLKALESQIMAGHLALTEAARREEAREIIRYSQDTPELSKPIEQTRIYNPKFIGYREFQTKPSDL